MDNIKLKEIAGLFPRQPGVYTFLGQRGKPIYVGKANNLRSRVSSYMKTTDFRIQKMVSEAHGVRYALTISDIEALILESSYIKKLQPQFNVRMRDDRQYLYVGITKEVFPHIYFTHQPQKKGLLEKARESLSVVLPTTGPSASARHQPPSDYVGPFTDAVILRSTLAFLRRLFPYCTCHQRHNNFCLNYHIGKCLGYCCLKERPDEVITSEEKKKRAEVKKVYLENIKAIKSVLAGKRVSLIKSIESDMKKEAQNGNLDEAIILREKAAALRRIFENAVVLKKRKPKKRNRDVLEKISTLFNLPRIPRRIEGYDISNIGGLSATGSMVVFEDGVANKNEYRKFKIRTVTSSDDPAMLREVLSRRFNHYEWSFPDLILIDGGKGQLSSAVAILSERHLDIPIISLTKDKKHRGHHVFGSHHTGSIELSTLDTTVKHLLLEIDAEAHRFAINYYRKVHRRSFDMA